MADIRNCKECGKIFSYEGFSRVCPRCRQKDEDAFRIVKEYVYDHPRATITEVAEETGVDEDKILRYLREGKLEIVGDGSTLVLGCERCGKGITTGRFCDACAREMEVEFKKGLNQSAAPKSTKTDKDKMYITDMKKRK
ncbi:MAG: TIGR03826 family flagellar region protein [Bacillota bacterium]